MFSDTEWMESMQAVLRCYAIDRSIVGLDVSSVAVCMHDVFRAFPCVVSAKAADSAIKKRVFWSSDGL